MTGVSEAIATINGVISSGRVIIKRMYPMPPVLPPCHHWVLPAYLQNKDKVVAVHGSENGNMVKNDIT